LVKAVAHLPARVRVGQGVADGGLLGREPCPGTGAVGSLQSHVPGTRACAKRAPRQIAATVRFSWHPGTWPGPGQGSRTERRGAAGHRVLAVHLRRAGR